MTRTQHRATARIGLAVLTIALAACSSGGDREGGGTPPAAQGTTVSGTATAPNGSLAKVTTPEHKAWYTRLFSGSEAWAQVVTGLAPVPNASINVFRIDSTGAPIGAVLAQTTTDGSGNYSLTLPAGSALSSDILVQVTQTGLGPQPIGTANTMSAPLVQTTVNIDPVSEGVMREALAYIAAASPPRTLADFSNGELTDLIAMIRAVLAANPNLIGGTIAQTITNIQATLAPQINQAIPQMATGTRYLIIFSTALPNGQVNVAYNQPILAMGAPGPLTYQVIAGSLPAGFNLDTATGRITGTPTGAGPANFTAQVSVAAPPPTPVTQALSITIAAAAPPMLSLSIAGNGFGIISDDFITPTFQCIKNAAPALCEQPFTGPTTMTLTAAISPGSVFGGWTGCDSTGTDAAGRPQCTILINGHRTVQAVLNRP